jgi:hypothetical protein
MICIDPADLRSLERSEAKASRVQRGGAMNAIFDVTDHQALDGQVVKFDEPFSYKGDLIMLRSGCFGDVLNHRVAFLIDHEASIEVAGTDDALSVMIDDIGIQFRLDLAKCRLGPVISRMCSTDNRSSTSIGCDILKEHSETISGQTVRIVTRARIKEITLCKNGAAGENAFAMLVDTTFTPKPVAGLRSATFKAQCALHKVARTVKTLKAQIAARHEQPLPVKRSMTVDQSNRLQTIETEKLIAAGARAQRLHSM